MKKIALNLKLDDVQVSYLVFTILLLSWFSFIVGAGIGIIIWLVMGWYILFQGDEGVTLTVPDDKKKESSDSNQSGE